MPPKLKTNFPSSNPPNGFNTVTEHFNPIELQSRGNARVKQAQPCPILPEMKMNGHEANKKSGDFLLNFSKEFGVVSDDKLSFMGYSDL
jgi:hypothetical protein